MKRRQFIRSSALGIAGMALSTPRAMALDTIQIKETRHVYTAGEDGVHTYRIPAMLVAPDKSLLLFCEARKESIKDASPTAMVLKRSLDDGKSWEPMHTLVAGEGDEAIMNPCPVVDRTNNTVLLIGIDAHKRSHGHHRHMMLKSGDNGVTWGNPIDLEPRITNYDDSFVSGPGVSIQLQSGRLVVPGYTGTYEPETRTGLYARVLYSDDHGETWTLGDAVSIFSNECQAVELKDGTLMLNMRENTGESCRAVALSSDGGATWDKLYWDRALNECPCQASIIRYGFDGQDDKDRLLFANPDVSGKIYGAVKRTRMALKISYDEGKTWPVEKLIHSGPSSYSSLLRLANGDIGLVFEGGEEHRREWIRFVRLALS